MQVATDSPRQYSRQDLLAACSFMATTPIETEDNEPIRIQDIMLPFKSINLPKLLPTITEEETESLEVISKSEANK